MRTPGGRPSKRWIMAWVVLLAAGLFEVVWAVGLKFLNGFEKPGLLIFVVGAIVLSMALLSLAMKSIPMGTAYAIWTGIGILGTFILGVLFFEESMNWVKILSCVLILAGLIGLKLA